MLLVALVLPAASARAQEATAADAGAITAPAPRSTPSIGLDRLLRPPGGILAPRPDRAPGGRDREDWQRRFAEARTEVRELRVSVDEVQDRMRDASSGSYSYSPAGASETYDPEVLKLRAQLQRDRQSLETAERRLRDLEVEASLAGVPPSWQQPPDAAAD